MARPRKLADPKRLEEQAVSWAMFFYDLRDEQPGLVYRESRQPKNIVAEIIPAGPKSKKVNEFIRRIKKTAGADSWVIFEPLSPAPHAWEQLKRARTADAVRKAAASIRPWELHRIESDYRMIEPDYQQMIGANSSDAICEHAEALVRAKQLPEYPRDPASNDDKRIIFFAKVMAGLMFGLAPLTTIRRLSHWRLPRDWGNEQKGAIP